MQLKKRHNWLQSWDTGQEASQCQSVHTVLRNTCQSSQLVTLSIAFNKHSPPRTPREGNSSAQTAFESQVAVTEPDEIVAGKNPAILSEAHPLRAGGITPSAAVLGTDRDSSHTPLTFTTRSEQSPAPTPRRLPAGQTGPARGQEPRGAGGAVPAAKVTLPATGPRDLPPGASRALSATKPPPRPRPGPGAPGGLRPRQGPPAPSTAAPRDLPRTGPRRLRAARRAAAAPPRALPLRPAAPRPYPA